MLDTLGGRWQQVEASQTLDHPVVVHSSQGSGEGLNQGQEHLVHAIFEGRCAHHGARLLSWMAQQ
eukprot:1539833-Pyramimonas_sp.AAC.1